MAYVQIATRFDRLVELASASSLGGTNEHHSPTSPL
jgi:hypothetical protein